MVKLAKVRKKKYLEYSVSLKGFLAAVGVCPLTGARDDPKNIFVQASVQEGAGARRRHQRVGVETIFSSILKKTENTLSCSW